jgi:hypothetical protein
MVYEENNFFPGHPGKTAEIAHPTLEAQVILADGELTRPPASTITPFPLDPSQLVRQEDNNRALMGWYSTPGADECKQHLLSLNSEITNKS